MKVILDCDNTMGVKKSDIDDGLTFAYLYAHPEIEILGITCTFANNNEHVVYYNTMQMMEDLKIKNIPVLKGGRQPEDYESEAVDYLVHMADRYPGEITVIAVGSMCNIAGAYKKDTEFFHKIHRLIVMGGVLEPLYLNGVLCRELNFSADPVSAASVVYSCPKLSILTAQCTKEAVYRLEDLENVLDQKSEFMEWSRPIIKDWIERKTRDYGNRPVFINWDLCTAIYLTNPELFISEKQRVVKHIPNMSKGWIQIDADSEYPDEIINLVDIPKKIIDIKTFNEKFYEMMLKMN